MRDMKLIEEWSVCDIVKRHDEIKTKILTGA